MPFALVLYNHDGAQVLPLADFKEDLGATFLIDNLTKPPRFVINKPL
jgi:hypothetical protein